MSKHEPKAHEQSRLDSFQPSKSLEIEAELHADLSRYCYGQCTNVRRVAEIAISMYLSDEGYVCSRWEGFQELYEDYENCRAAVAQSEYNKWRRENPERSSDAPLGCDMPL